ncbi:MAG: conjugal transfer protein TraD [Alphaproteobacteria bacterium]|nr:conjugal transfer protein TraD [Alphaproteobacteria bacterium]
MENKMRKPRDYDAELTLLKDKARQLKERKVRQLGELIIATGADTLSPEILAGALLVIIDSQDGQKRESWRKRGESFFQKQDQHPQSQPQSDQQTTQSSPSSAQSTWSRPVPPRSPALGHE